MSGGSFQKNARTAVSKNFCEGLLLNMEICVDYEILLPEQSSKKSAPKILQHKNIPVSMEISM